MARKKYLLARTAEVKKYWVHIVLWGCRSMYMCLISGGHGRRNVSAELQMVAQYAAQVAHREDGHHVQSNHSPENYRQVTSNGNSVSDFALFDCCF